MSSVEYIREIMLCAAKRNLVNGDYVFIAVNPLAILGHPGEHHYYYWFHNLLGYQNTGDTDTEEEDRKNYPLLRKAYKTLLIMGPEAKLQDPERFERFEQEVGCRMSLSPFKVNESNQTIFMNDKDPKLLCKNTSKSKVGWFFEMLV